MANTSNLNTVIREGTALAYALAQLPPQKKADIVAILQLSHTLATMLNDVTDPSVAEKKIHWWHEELDRMQNGKAKHPLCLAVSTSQASLSTELTHWMSILSANSDEKYINAGNEETFLARLEQDYTARLQLCCLVLQKTPARLNPKWSTGFALFERLKRFHHLHACGYPVFPDSDYALLAIEPHDLANSDKHNAVKALFAKHTRAARDDLSAALDDQETALSLGCLPIYILAYIRVAQLSSWQRQELILSEAYSTLTPIKKALLAWRCRAKYRNLGDNF